MPSAEHIEVFRVRSSDTDASNHWKLHEMHCLLQETAKNHAQILGVGYEHMYARGQAWVLARMRIRVEKLPQMGAEVEVRTWPRGIQQRLFYQRDYLLSCAGEVAVRVSSAWLVIDLAARRMLLPERLAFDFPTSPREALPGEVEKAGITADLPELARQAVTYSQVDAMEHLNSARYLAWIEDVLPPEMLLSQRLREVLLTWSAELRLGDTCAIHGQASPDGLRWELRGLEPLSGKRTFDASLILDPP